MISVAEALDRIFALAAPVGRETVGLRQAAGRVLAEPAVARRTQPPFAASAMDGYAIRGAELAIGAGFEVVGESAAGGSYPGTLAPGEAVRIFTGAPVPAGADHVVIQEDTRREGSRITLAEGLGDGANIRPAGGDFSEGDEMLAPGRRLGPAEIALLAAMNIPQVAVYRRPDVALICTGDELVMPGETPGPSQIVTSNAFGLAAMFEAAGASARILPIARDTAESLEQCLDLAAEADLVVTCGGASVGEHDIVADVARARGMALEFHKVAMRPGKPLMAGRMGGVPMVGLPGNPVSAMVCGRIFVVPMLEAMTGRTARPAARATIRLAAPIPANGPREHYMRATLGPEGIALLPSQDSSLLGILAQADALLVRPPSDPARDTGASVEYIAL
ncbi:gephyrin-like molybdotransferase Glp [Poseidonocella sp. HB161398]|uniref:molybdopterin molybdotransferase MoeA n=1 Tax=Poseidonocella sp. HB161398 TaxID=2320855 RepID=UPI0011097D4F|nr:gephyrin-like molybdotransferase Glp [Poseidonocella sp. HB161398]